MYYFFWLSNNNKDLIGQNLLMVVSIYTESPIDFNFKSLLISTLETGDAALESARKSNYYFKNMQHCP